MKDKERTCGGCLKNCLAFVVVAVLAIWSLAQCQTTDQGDRGRAILYSTPRRSKGDSMMGKSDYTVSWIEGFPTDIPTNYPRRWALARSAIRELSNGRDEVLQIDLPSKRDADLCKSAIYSESSAIRQNQKFDFKTKIVTVQKDDGTVTLYIDKTS